MSERVRVTEETYEALAKLKRDGETFDDVVRRLLASRRRRIRAGAGLWDGTDAPAAARARRLALKGEREGFEG